MPHAPSVHIVIIEDDPDDFELTRMVLTRECPHVVIQHLGNQFDWDSFLNNHAVMPALVLMDYRFGPLTGLEMLTRLKSAPVFATTPVLVWSGSVNEADVKACLEAGAAGYMAKPYDLHEFIQTMKAICASWLS